MPAPRGTITERKVARPLRWLKGLTAAQGYLAQMDSTLRLSRAQAARVYATPDGQASAVLLELGGGHEFLLVLSAAASRGFSGEGTQLGELLNELPAEWLAGASNLFRANETFNPILFGLAHDLAPGTVARLCASLSAMGVLGFDLTDNQYFYRRLPFRTNRISQLSPRLKNARTLLATPDEVQLVGVGHGGRTQARVRGTDVWHTVLVGGPEPPRCTCQWFTTCQRGLCKHILAAQLRLIARRVHDEVAAYDAR